MNPKKRIFGAAKAAFLLAILLMLAGLAFPESSQAGLPPRPEPTPTPVVVRGAFIELRLESPAAAGWSQVQWLAGDGHWYDVDGWAGQPDHSGIVTWYVGPELVGAEASFRWQLFQEEGGDLLQTSDPFLLPESARQAVIVTLE